jgi:chloramphenicol-sensitive protein RarD
MSSARKGYLFAISAYLCWGFLPLYWKLLRPMGALEILAHRLLWSCLIMLVVISIARGWRRIADIVRQPRKLALITLAAMLIAVNWGAYIYGVNTDRVVETSLGYFINPLVTVLLGVLVLGERLRSAQWVAIGVGAVAVAVLTVDYGHVPFLALMLAASFGLYGLVKKSLGVRATDGLLVEAGVLAVPALVFVWFLGARGEATFGHVSPLHTVLVVAAGAVTVIPLLFFAGAANRVPLSAIGLLQYLAPILQLVIGVLIFHEPMPTGRLVGFALVWLALGVFTWDGIRHARSHSRRTMPAAQPAPAGN